ncbi:SDR family oxidoreductase [Caulobacter endophyticus]|uniref:NAD(P)-dependent oxidoreductase n=1 Tax=Caulobacter endophyticus TaxID=2172652 RepID=A0A2T9K9R3_9CAUL|nr:SDR family oxidoreductase [Caulobacter endophyticus]PVM92720.1 NAD(P)-dependent oxidoreductase [Caulobacter endophyticus]
MKIGVNGASGKLGQTILAELKARGAEDIVAISRTPDATEGVEARRGDYDQPETLAAAYAGLDRLVLIPSPDFTPGRRTAQVLAAIDAAVEAGVKHIVLLSAAGTRQAADPAVGGAYWLGEQHLIRKAQAWTIVRMNYYSESMAEQIANSVASGVLPGLGSERVAYVSRDDFAAALAGVLVGEGHAGAIYNATGPEIVTGEDRAALAAELFGRPVEFKVVPADLQREQIGKMGLPSFVVDAIMDMKAMFVEGYFDIVTTDIERLSGRPAKSFREVLATYVK